MEGSFFKQIHKVRKKQTRLLTVATGNESVVKAPTPQLLSRVVSVHPQKAV